MADPISDLEQQLAQVVSADELPRLFAAIDHWRHTYGGDKVYIAAYCKERRDERVKDLRNQGLSANEVASKVGLSPRQVKRLSKKSSYL